MGWTRRDPSRYGFGPASWRLDMVNGMIRREIGRHARRSLVNSGDLCRSLFKSVF